jgi:hypothetical protein
MDVAIFLFAMTYWNLSFKLKYDISGKQMEPRVSNTIKVVYYLGITINATSPAIAYGLKFMGFETAVQVFFAIFAVEGIVTSIFFGDALNRIRNSMKG